MQNSSVKWFMASVISFFLPSTAVWFMPLVSFEQEEQKTFAFVLAAVFWIGLGFGYRFTIFNRYAAEKGYKI